MVAIGTHFQCGVCKTAWFQNAVVHPNPRFCPCCGRESVRSVIDRAARFSDPADHPMALDYAAQKEAQA